MATSSERAKENTARVLLFSGGTSSVDEVRRALRSPRCSRVAEKSRLSSDNFLDFRCRLSRPGPTAVTRPRAVPVPLACLGGEFWTDGHCLLARVGARVARCSAKRASHLIIARTRTACCALSACLFLLLFALLCCLMFGMNAVFYSVLV